MIKFSKAEHNSVLAGLRLLQQHNSLPRGLRQSSIDAIADDGGVYLNNGQIEDLCERLNTEEVT